MKKKIKCYIYTRVSTAIQVDGYSLDAQKDKLRKYAEFQDMEIASFIKKIIDNPVYMGKIAYGRRRTEKKKFMIRSMHIFCLEY